MTAHFPPKLDFPNTSYDPIPDSQSLMGLDWVIS